MTNEPPVGGAPYEFRESENAALRSLAMRARVWGALSSVGGTLCLFFAAHAALVATRGDSGHRTAMFLFAAIPQLSVGVSFLGAARALFAVTDTKGDDVPLFLKAVTHLTGALRVQFSVTILFILTIAAMAASVYLLDGLAHDGGGAGPIARSRS